MRYHQALATGGLLRPNGQRLTLLPYDPEQIEGYVRGQLRRFGVAADLEPEHFHTSDKAWERHPDWVIEAKMVTDYFDNLFVFNKLRLNMSGY
jgi:hypothetical protein